MDLIRASQALPAYEDWTGFSGINRDGELVYVEEGAQFAVTMLNEPLFQRVALFEASRRFPTLESLLPQRPEHARKCAGCSGTGRIDFGNSDEALDVNVADCVRCFCGGLGWIL